MQTAGYLNTKNKTECYGCEACAQACPSKAIQMAEDEEGFRYPAVNDRLCIQCGLCNRVCPFENPPEKYTDGKYAFGGYHLDENTRFESTSGGAFSAIVEAFCDENYVVFGAEADGIAVNHGFITDKTELGRFRKSKYVQSVIGQSYLQAKQFLKEGKKVLFSGTPCQIAALKSFLGKTKQDNLLTVEVVCEGVPSPHYIRKYSQYLENKYGAPIKTLDYRFTGRGLVSRGKWDFQQMKAVLSGAEKSVDAPASDRKKTEKTITKDRWFNPFWSVWLNHLMSRPSCYACGFAQQGRTADISLGDLWGVHLYCPELYGSNGGASLVVANTEKGREIVKKAEAVMFGHELKFEDALRYQSPMRKHIDANPERTAFMNDLESGMDYRAINRKWAKQPTVKLLWQKYVWGNRQKIFVWNFKNVRAAGKKEN